MSKSYAFPTECMKYIFIQLSFSCFRRINCSYFSMRTNQLSFVLGVQFIYFELNFSNYDKMAYLIYIGRERGGERENYFVIYI